MSIFKKFGLYSPNKGGHNDPPTTSKPDLAPPPQVPKGGSGEVNDEYFWGKYGFKNDKIAKQILNKWKENPISNDEYIGLKYLTRLVGNLIAEIEQLKEEVKELNNEK